MKLERLWDEARKAQSYMRNINASFLGIGNEGAANGLNPFAPKSGNPFCWPLLEGLGVPEPVRYPSHSRKELMFIALWT